MRSADEKYPFIPAAMLPAWLVTDGEWIVRNSNGFAAQMLAGLDPEHARHLTSGRITFGEVYPTGDAFSAWACFLELDKKQTQLALDATRVMAEHVRILKRYAGASLNLDLQALMVELRRVEGSPGVYPYVFDRVEDEEYLRMGIRVSPPEGLKLRVPVSLADPENSDPGSTTRPMTYIDFVIGYQVKLCPAPHNPSFVTCVHFLGSQPAIHDATDRRRLVQLEKELEEIRTTSNLAHALRTPLSNAVAAARRINKPGGRPDDARRLSGPLLAQIDEADALVRLLLFVNANDALPVSARLSNDAADPAEPTITSAIITRQIADALMSIFHMRTDRPRDRRNVIALLATHGVAVPAEQGGEEVAASFRQLAEQISGGDAASFTLSADVHSLRFSSIEAAHLARTVALNLILTELIVNAVKHCDSSNPRICFNAALTAGAIHWTVENTVPPAKTGEAAPGEPARISGAKREALGNFLNHKATKILGWRLERLDGQPGWIRHSLVIPLEGERGIVVVVGVIEDQWLDLMKVCGNFLVHAASGTRMVVRPYLLGDSDVPARQDILDIQQEVQRYHPAIEFPPITFLPSANLREDAESQLIIEQLARDGVNVIVSDSQIGDDEVAGLRLLDAALSSEGLQHRSWSCHLMTKHFASASRLIYSKENGIVDSRIRYLDKTKLLGAFPDECADDVSALLEREFLARAAAVRIAGRTHFGDFIGASRSLNEGSESPYAVAQIVAESDSSVLIRGEAGSGKEVLARAIHKESDRKNQPFVAVDCGALPESTIESELFGHRKGSFTGAFADRAGRIKLADKGTLFLDEIGNMPVSIQAKFLRVLAEHEVTPLGGRPEKVNFRLIAATNAPIERLIEGGRFLPDLLDRITTWEITLPPLRERSEDIPALVADLIKRLASNFGGRRFLLADHCMPILREAEWPGNVRALSHCIERAMGFAKHNATTHQVQIKAEHVRLALPKVKAAVGKGVPPSQGEKREPDPAMTADEIWSGLRDGRLQRQSLPDLVERLGSEKVGAILLCADDNIVRSKGLEKYFPGSTQVYKRAIKSRYLKRNTPKAS